MGRLRSRLYKTDRARDFEHEQDRQVRTRQVYETIDRQSFQWIVVLVAGIGFFLDGYTLFASNMALPMVSYVFWRDETSGQRLMCINIATLAGTLLGQVSFGYLADRYGRKKMYGVELTLLITSTLGVVMSSTGVNNSMDVFAWLIWWRIVVGIGVGADYPLSAVITSEFAPTKHRARMMATVFFMQPLGQIAGNLVALVVIAASKSKEHETVDVIRSVDTMWRWVIGIGVIPGAIATLFRFAIPESPRFLMEIEDDPVQAEFDATNLFSQEPPSSPGGVESMSSWNDLPLPSMSVTSPSIIEEPLPSSQGNMLQPATLNSHWRLTNSDIVQYFWTEGNWRTLVATTLTWLLMDFGFYGISLSSPQFLAKTWGTLHLSDGAPPWQTDDRAQADIYQMFLDSSVHGLVILNSGSFLGCLLLILLVYRLDRVGLQKWAFLALSALFIAMGTMFITVHNGGPVAIVLYIIAQTLFNFGPNATTYIIPAEIFPTRYRSTCHGISGAGGKLGSILVQLISNYYRFGSAPGNEATIRHGYVLIVFSACMILGAAVTHFWIPPVQRQNGKGKLWGGKSETLETLALGRLGGRSRYAGPGSRGRTGSGRPVSFASWGV